MLTGSIYQKDKTIVNIYVPNVKAPKYLKQILAEPNGEIESNTKIVRDFKDHFQWWIDHPDRKSIGKQWHWTTLYPKWT